MRESFRPGLWQLFFMIAVVLVVTPPVARGEDGNTLEINALLERLEKTQWEESVQGRKEALVLGGRIRIEGCRNYPYHDNSRDAEGFLKLAADLRQGVEQGLVCMAGLGPAGSLHPYHALNARRLADLLNDGTGKILSCVEDETFAYAIAHPSGSPSSPNRVLIDTYRISGFLSRRFERTTYRDFFKLSEPLIEDHLTGKPLHLDGMHRYRDLPGLVFHELTHWLGYEHTNLTADVVDLYEVCCFGGSDHIQDDELNRGFQQRACSILKDGELWDADEETQKRLWHERGYYLLKRDIRRASG